MDIPIKLKFNVEKYNNPSDVKNVKVKWEPVVKDEN